MVNQDDLDLIESFTLDEVKDELIGPKGTARREIYEFELRLDVLSETLKKVRKQRKLTQSELGKLVGVQKAQISKLEKSPKNVTIETIVKIFKALNANVKLQVELEGVT
jgi:DNA-binding XRE family transcriptional regulator